MIGAPSRRTCRYCRTGLREVAVTSVLVDPGGFNKPLPAMICPHCDLVGAKR